MTALVGMRIAGFVRGGRALAPMILALVVLAVIHGGGSSPAAAAYGYSAVALFPVLAWQTKLLLDAEPDGQRRLARLAVGAGREATAGLLAATLIALAVCAMAMLAPLPFHAVRGPLPGTAESSLTAGVAVGVLAHVFAVGAGVALGALSSRAVTRQVRIGVAVLVGGVVLAIVFGLRGSFAPWLVPPLMATARALTAERVPAPATLLQLAAWTVVWCAVALALYARLRVRRA